MWRKHNRDIEERELQVNIEPLGKRIGRFVTLMGMIFAVSGGVVVTQRLSEDALALLLGLSCGVAVMVPTVVLGGLWMKRELGQKGSRQRAMDNQQTMGQPQIVVVAPQSLPGYGQNYGQSAPTAMPAQWQPVPVAREFKIVGGMD